MDSPMIKATLQAGALSGLSNILGQLITCGRANKPYIINPIELAHFVLFSLMVCPPNYLWQSWLEAQFPGYTDRLTSGEKEKLVDDVGSQHTPSAEANGTIRKRSTAKKEHAMTEKSTSQSAESGAKSLNLKNTAIKFSLDQTIGAAVNTVLFIAGIALLRGHSWAYIQADCKEKFWPMIFAGQKLWPLVSVLNFTVIPLEQRTLFGSIIGLFWGIYLSIVTGEKK